MREQPEQQAPPVQRLRIRYAKRGRLRFTSHRDFSRAFERAVFRARIPMAYSSGFNPHPRISYAGAAPTGSASEAEYLEIALAQVVDPADVHAELEEVRALLSGPEASVRLVLTPETVVLAEARRSYTNLSLFGYRVDGVVANRVFPSGGDAWRAGWVAAQDAVLAQVSQSFAGLPVWRSEYRPGEPVGVEALHALATEVYDGSDPLAPPQGEGPFQVTRTERGAELRLALPFVTRAEVDLARNGDELVVTVGSYRRLLTLPSGLSRLRVAGARVEDGRLRVRFAEPAGDVTASDQDRQPQEARR